MALYSKSGQKLGLSGGSMASAPAPVAAPPVVKTGFGAKKNVLGQPIVAEPPKVAAAPMNIVTGAGTGLKLRQGGTSGGLKLENAKLQAELDAESSPRSMAARLMKRQAGIGQLSTYRKPEAEV